MAVESPVAETAPTEPERIAAWVEGWARRGGILVRRGPEPRPYRFPPAERGIAGHVVNRDPCTDYGRVFHRVPACVVEPRTQDELVECVRRLADARVPYKVRGCAHSAGGQVLIDGGVVVTTRFLSRVVHASRESDTVVVEGGARWLHLLRRLAPLGRRPAVLTGNLLTSVAGTLAGGGVGSTSMHHGMQIASVTGLTLVLPTAERVRVGPQDELFRYTLAGAGQLAIIAEAEMKTLRRPPRCIVQQLRWSSLEGFCSSVARLRDSRRFEVLGARFHYPTPSSAAFLAGFVGVFTDLPEDDEAAVQAVYGNTLGKEVWTEGSDLDERTAPEPSRDEACPALPIFLPLPDGVRVWEEIVGELQRAGLTAWMRRGSSTQLLRADRRLPLAPYPESDECLFFALRPEIPRAELSRAMPALRRVAGRVLDAGGKIDLLSIRPEGEFLSRQLGPELGRLRELKARVDPHGLLNPGLLTPEPDGR